MKKKNELAKKLKLILIILIVVLISLVSFFGIFDKVNNISFKNIIKEYALGRDLEGSRIIKISVKNTDDNEVSKEDMLKIKNSLEKRLKGLNANDYVISQNLDNGEVTINLTDDNNTDYVVSQLTGLGKFELIDSDTKEVLLNNDDIDKTDVNYYDGQNGRTIYLSIKMKKDGKNKLSDITKNYIKTTTDENGQEQEVEKKVTLKMEDEEVLTTSFEEPITTGVWDLTMGTTTTDNTQIESNIKNASAVSTLLNSGYIPQTLTITENDYMETMLNKTVLYTILVLIALVLVFSIIYMIIKYKKLGLVSILTYLFEVSLFMLLVRYTNTIVTVSSIVSLGLLVIINHLLMNDLLKEYTKSKNISKSIGRAYLKHIDTLVVLLIVAVVCILVNWVPLNGIGLPLFWGLISIGMSNIITKETIE